MEEKPMSFERLVLEYLSGVVNELDYIASSVNDIKKSVETVKKDIK